MKFIRENFNYHGGYLTYEGKFIARFKHMKSNKPTFLTFLIKNFTQEEYFDLYNSNMAPAKILETKGYLPSHIKKWLKKGGYTINLSGYDKFIRDQSNFRL